MTAERVSVSAWARTVLGAHRAALQVRLSRYESLSFAVRFCFVILSEVKNLSTYSNA
jgi:hypothetical protein